MIGVYLRFIIVLVVCSPTFAIALEKGPDLRLQIADQALTLEWSSVPDAISYKGYYKDFPEKKDQEYSSLDLGNITALTAKLPYGSKFIIAISAVTENGETERSSFKIVQIDSPKGTYLENVADPINYNFSGIYNYSGLP